MNFYKLSKKFNHKLAVSSAIFKIDKKVLENNFDNLQILLIKRESEPYLNKLSLPGGKINENEKYDEATLRECYEETGYKVFIPKNHLIKVSYVKNYLIITSLSYFKEDQIPNENCEKIEKVFKTYDEIKEMPNRLFVVGLKDVIFDSFEFFEKHFDKHQLI